MRLDAGQHLRLDQRMKLAPRMIQSMEILQLPAVALEERIEQELASNPTLELREAGADAEQIQAEREQAQRDAREGERELNVDDNSGNNTDDFERLTNIAEEYGDSWGDNAYETGSFRPSRYEGERDAKMDAMANTAARGQCLSEQLADQWSLVEAAPEVKKAGEYLIGLIDDDGYLRTPWQDVLHQAPGGLDEAAIKAALDKLQRTLEPAGLAARDLRECLLLQMDAKQHSEDGCDLRVERKLVEDHLKDIEANRLPRIAKETGFSLDEIKQGLLGLRQFVPHPGRMLVDAVPQIIRPDARVWYDEEEDRYQAELLNDRANALYINPRYLRMIKQAQLDGHSKKFIRDNLRSAGWLIDAIVQRQNTLLRVINVVLEAQRDFFDQGESALKPLPMTQVADQLGVHVATVSRAVSEKHMETPRGIYPLRMFFSGGTETESGDAMSWTAVQAKLQEVVDAEDKSKPLSDDMIAEQLKKQGIDIARRTVAKYRGQLNIPPARQRKEY